MADGNVVTVFVEDLEREGFAGVWASMADDDAAADRRSVVEGPGAIVTVAAIVSGPRSPAARLALAAFRDHVAGKRAATA